MPPDAQERASASDVTHRAGASKAFAGPRIGERRLLSECLKPASAVGYLDQPDDAVVFELQEVYDLRPAKRRRRRDQYRAAGLAARVLESALFDDAQRAALALTEAITRLADHPDSVSDEIWAATADQFDESELAALVSMAALTNFFNRVNTTLRIQPGSPG